MRAKELLGREGGTEPVILVWYRRPWAVYLSVRTTLRLSRYIRLRVSVGPAVSGWLRVEAMARSST